jgi:hypothetical protein
MLIQQAYKFPLIQILLYSCKSENFLLKRYDSEKLEKLNEKQKCLT